MGKLDVETAEVETDDFEGDQELEQLAGKMASISKDMRRRLEDRLDDVRLNKQLREYDYRDI